MVSEGRLSLTPQGSVANTQEGSHENAPGDRHHTPSPFFREDNSAEWDAYFAEWLQAWQDEEMGDIPACASHIQWGQYEEWQQFADDDADTPEWALVHQRADARIKELMGVVRKAATETQSSINETAFLNAINDGDIQAAVDAVNWTQAGATILVEEMTPLIADLLGEVGQDSIELVTSAGEDTGHRFDNSNPRVQAALTNGIGNAISGINNDQLGAIRNVVEDLVDGQIPFQRAVDTIKQHMNS